MKTKKWKHKASVSQSADAEHVTNKQTSKKLCNEKEKKLDKMNYTNHSNSDGSLNIKSINKENQQQKWEKQNEEHQDVHDDNVREEINKCTPSLQELSKIFDKVEFNFLIGNTLPHSSQYHNGEHESNSNNSSRNSLLYPRDLGNLILWSVPTPVPLIESPHKFFIKNKSKLRNVLMIYVNNKMIPQSKESTTEINIKSDTEHKITSCIRKNDNDENDDVSNSTSTENNNATEMITITKSHIVNTQIAKQNFDCSMFISQNIPYLPLLTYPSSSSCLSSSSSEKTNNLTHSSKRTNRFIQELFWRSSKPKTIIEYNGRHQNNVSKISDNSKQEEHQEHASSNDLKHHHNNNNNNCSLESTNKCNKQNIKGRTITTASKEEVDTSMSNTSELGVGAHSLFKRAREIHASMLSNTSSPTPASPQDKELQINEQCDNMKIENTEQGKAISVNKETNKNDVCEINTNVEPDVENERKEEDKAMLEWFSVWGNVHLLKSYALHWPEHEHELLSLGYTLSVEHQEEEEERKNEDVDDRSSDLEKVEEPIKCKAKWMCLSSNTAKCTQDKKEEEEQNMTQIENTNAVSSHIKDSKKDYKDEKYDIKQDYGVFALDCEMVLTTGYVSSLARITLINVISQTIILDELVKPSDAVVNYLTRYSGVTHDDLVNVCTTLQDIQTKLKDLFAQYKECFIVGHSLENDFKALYWLPHEVYIIDTAYLYPHHCQLPLKNSLKWLANKHLHMHIQHSAHDSAEDALVSAKLAFLKLQNGPSFGVSNLHKYSVLQLIKDGLVNNRYYSENNNKYNNKEEKNVLSVDIKLFDDATILQHILPSQTSSTANNTKITTITKPKSYCTDNVNSSVNDVNDDVNIKIEEKSNDESVCDSNNKEKGKFVIDCISTRSDEDATRKCIRALKQVNKSNLESLHSLQSCKEDTYHLMWIQLSEQEHEVLQKYNENDKEEREEKEEICNKENVEGAMNERVKRIIEAAPRQTLILLLVSELYCSDNSNNNNINDMHTTSPTPYLKTQGACFAFVKDESIDLNNIHKNTRKDNLNNTENTNNADSNISTTTTTTTKGNIDEKIKEAELTELPTPSGCEHQEENEY